MNFDKDTFKKAVQDFIKFEYKTEIGNASVQQIHNAVGKAVMGLIGETWELSGAKHLANRRACYFSMEFLMGRAVFSNLFSLGILDDVQKALAEIGADLNALEDIEDAALGNGGLGRLAACFLDSAATHNIPLDGYGIRYKYGLFKQTFKDGFQKEIPDDWTKYGDPWAVRKEGETEIVEYADMKVKAVPYDLPIIGYGTENIGTLRLWQAEAVDEFDFETFNNGDYIGASKGKIFAEDISRCLYPNDNTREGLKLRLRQEYFFCAASIADILRKYFAKNDTVKGVEDFIAIQLNDTHPVISIPELIRQLGATYSVSFNEAFEIAKKVFSYTNHTIMPEALEKWEVSLMREILPEIYAIVARINENLISELYQKLPQITKPGDAESADYADIKAQVKNYQIIDRINPSYTVVHMARLACYVGRHINGVAAIHTEILKENTLKQWYRLHPEKFLNMTNGITQRRFLGVCNPRLTALFTKLLGSDDFLKDLSVLKQLGKLSGNENVIKEFIQIKQENKEKLARYILAREGVKISPNTIFDIQIKRLHEYKRQLLNAFSILYIFFGIKDGEIKNFAPTTFIFGAKAAPGYSRAKAIIKYINEIGKFIAADKDVRELIKVVFVTDYNVSYAEKLVAAADVSEQISTAGTEASGTGNMKLMLNGAVTLGTLDGANIEIAEEAGEENNYIFGAKVDEIDKLMANKSKLYDSRELVSENPKIRRVLNTLIDGTFSDGGNNMFEDLYYSLLDGASWHTPDNYYVLGDLEGYVAAKLKLNTDYKNSLEFAKKQWQNAVNAGKFSSDRTIRDYAEKIWGISG